MEAFTSFFANKKNIAIAAAAAVALGVGLFALFSGGEPPVDERREDPEKYIRLAFENMTRSLELPDPDVGWMFDILDGRHEIDLGLSFRDINIPLPVDRQIMLLAQLARLDANITRDTAAREMQADLNLSTGGVPMLSADMYMSDDEFALRLPQGFDYFVTLDPRHATGALTDSLLGEYVAQWIMTGDLMDAFIYEIYSRLFTAVKNPGMLMLANDTGTLFEGAEFGFMDETDGVYVYSLVINGDSFNSWFRSFVRSLENFELFRQLGVDLSGLHYFTVTGDVEMLLDVRDDFILGGTADVPLYGGAAASVRFILYGERNPADAVEITLEMKNPNSTFNESAGRA
ncbi:MAG: hypothetical protein FWE60_03605, partial [Oscillospiraceae bacterium]|nr:hypothetical protein [Oscillospiraceae bacterium]